jgi:hypothetical protein
MNRFAKYQEYLEQARTESAVIFRVQTVKYMVYNRIKMKWVAKPIADELYLVEYEKSQLIMVTHQK